MVTSSRLAVLLTLMTALSLAAAQVPPPAVPSAPPPPAPSTGNGSCNPLKLRVCASVLNGLLGVLLPPGGGNAANDSQCCPLLRGLVDLDAAVCLCTAIRANVLSIINLNVPLGLSLLLNHCDRAVPDDFTCA